MPLKPSVEDEELLWERPNREESLGISRKLLPPTDIGQDEAKKLIGTMLDQRHFELLLDETGTVGTPDGPICTLLRNRVPRKLCELVTPILRRAASQSVAGGNRSDAAGAGRKLRRRADGSTSKISGTPRLEDMSYEDYLRLEGAKDGLVGYMAQGQRGGAEYPCRMRSWSLKQTPREFGLLNELAAFVGGAWSHSILHIQHSIQFCKATEDTHPEYVMKTRRAGAYSRRKRSSRRERRRRRSDDHRQQSLRDR